MFLATYVDYWGEGQKRVRNFHTFDYFYLLNTNRMFEITETHDGYASMRFFDNPVDSRDGGARLKAYTTIANVIGFADFPHGSETITLDVFTDNDNTLATYELTLAKATIAYCYPADEAWDTMWVVYVDAGWNIQRVLVNEGAFVLWSRMFV